MHIRCVILKFLLLFALLGLPVAKASDQEARVLLNDLIIKDKEGQEEALKKLDRNGSKIIKTFFEVLRVGDVYSRAEEDGSVTVFYKEGEFYYSLLENKELTDTTGLEKARAKRAVKKKLKKLADFVDLYSPNERERIDAVHKFGASQNPEFIELIRTNIEDQPNTKLKNAFEEALAISLLKNGTHEEKMEGLSFLGEIGSSLSEDFINALKRESTVVVDSTEASAEEKANASQLLKACDDALKDIESHQKMLARVQAVFFGINRGSVLLLVSFGLAITFGLMGVINMAHGEFIAIGGYTTYVIQGWFASAYGIDSSAYGWYFIAAIPASFIIAAFFGVILERGVIQFLYRACPKATSL